MSIINLQIHMKMTNDENKTPIKEIYRYMTVTWLQFVTFFLSRENLPEVHLNDTINPPFLQLIFIHVAF